jgi:hypothetical protein
MFAQHPVDKGANRQGRRDPVATDERWGAEEIGAACPPLVVKESPLM